MKTKLLISFLLMTFISLSLPTVSVQGAETNPSPTSSFDMPVISEKSSQNSLMMSNYRSVVGAAGTSTNSSVNIRRVGGLRLTEWTDPQKPTGDGSNPGNMGAPIGGVSLPVAFFALLIYFVYRSVSTSKRRNNF